MINEGTGGYNALAGQAEDNNVSEGLAWGPNTRTRAFAPAGGSQQRQDRGRVTNHHLVRTLNA